MSRRSKETFLQRRHTDGQKAHEKMLNITNHQRNVNQNYNEVSPHTSQNGHHHQKVQIGDFPGSPVVKNLHFHCGGTGSIPGWGTKNPHATQCGQKKKKSLQIINAGESVEKREPSYTVGGNVNWYSHSGKQYGDFSKN